MGWIADLFELFAFLAFPRAFFYAGVAVLGLVIVGLILRYLSNREGFDMGDDTKTGTCENGADVIMNVDGKGCVCVPSGAQCPEGFDVVSGGCISKTGGTFVCAPMTGATVVADLVNGKCVYTLAAGSVVCPDKWGIDSTSGLCVPPTATVSAPYNPIKCPDGYYVDPSSGDCKCHKAVVPGCPTGYTLTGSQCVQTISATCPEGTILTDGQCKQTRAPTCLGGLVWSDTIKRCIAPPTQQ